MRLRNLILPTVALLCAACDNATGPANQAVPPATTDTDMTEPVNGAASNQADIPVVADPPTR